MVTRKIPSTGETLSVIGLGSWQTFDVGASAGERAPLAEVLKAFADLGGTLVDSSPMYGRSEAVIGDLASGLGLRDRLFLATKVWTSGRAAGIRQMEASLAKLKAGKMDLMQVHNLLRRLRGKPLPAWAPEIGCSSWAQVLLKFAVSHPAVTCAIPATSRLDHLRDNMGAGLGPMPDGKLRERMAEAAA